jgi:rhodanese-related sulfurtransferase
MPGLVPGIHVFKIRYFRQTWMVGSSLAMTRSERRQSNAHAASQKRRGNAMSQNITRGYKAMLDEANASIETIPAADAVKQLSGGADDVVIVDLRDPREIEREGRIPGAFSCPRGMLEFWIDPASPYAKPIFQGDKKFVFHCASGWRSALAAKTAQEMGLKPVAHIGGGFTGWREAGGAVEKVEPKKK